MKQRILSSLAGMPTSDFVYSSLSLLKDEHPEGLSGTWFVEALGRLGLGQSAIRQTLYRMERDGSLTARKAGRTKWYCVTPATAAITRIGRDRIFSEAPQEWDGDWTIVHIRFAAEEVQIRERIREILMVQGFAKLDPGVYLHPRDCAGQALDVATQEGVAHRIFVLRGKWHSPIAARALAEALWDLEATAGRYRVFVGRYGSVDTDSLTDREAFGIRFAVVNDFLRISWHDPELPQSLLPEDWPGREARELAANLYRVLAPTAVRYAERFVTPAPPEVNC